VRGSLRLNSLTDLALVVGWSLVASVRGRFASPRAVQAPPLRRVPAAAMARVPPVDPKRWN